MKRHLQACILIFLGCLTLLQAQEASPVKLEGNYQVVKVKESKFKTGLEMLGREQNEYATHLTLHALNHIKTLKGSQTSLNKARQLIGLALHLSPKNKEAVVANIQLSKGVFPRKVKASYSNNQLSMLLYARSGIQKEFEGEANQLLAQCFAQIAADLNPHNKEAIYDAAIFEQENGEIDWSQFTGK